MGFLKTAVRSWLGLSHEALKPLTDKEELRDRLMQRINSPKRDMEEFWLWFTADAQKLSLYYSTMLTVKGKQDYFYARSAYEENKKTHSGLPRAMVDTLANVTGVPIITVSLDETTDKVLIKQAQARADEIIEFNDFNNIVKQDARAKTLVIGSGVFFVSNLSHINPGLDKPIIEFIDERFCEIETIGNVFVSATKKTTYKKGDRNYTHYERRSYNLIENWLINDKDLKVPLETIPELAELEPEIALDIDMIPAVPCRYKNGHNSYGLSIYSGKVDLFDDYDQTTSQLAELVRKSTPVDYIPAELLPKDKNTGKALAPTVYDRKFLVLEKSMRQEEKEKIETNQPQLDFMSIIEAGKDQLVKIFNGVISPASLGLNVAADASGESIREKERVTFVTRDDIIDNERGVIQRVMELSLKIYDKMQGATVQEYDVHVDYPDFSAPTFDKLVQTLLPLWAQDGISPEKFVDLLYSDTMTPEDREKEIEYLTGSKEKVVDYNFFGENEEGSEIDFNEEEQEEIKEA